MVGACLIIVIVNLKHKRSWGVGMVEKRKWGKAFM